MKLYTSSEYMITDTSFEKKIKTKKSSPQKMKLYRTSEFINNDISFEKKNLTTKMKLVNNKIYLIVMLIQTFI